MLKDATKDKFDVILAWREDRLYRGLRSMLTVMETVQDYKIEEWLKGWANEIKQMSGVSREFAFVRLS